MFQKYIKKLWTEKLNKAYSFLVHSILMTILVFLPTIIVFIIFYPLRLAGQSDTPFLKTLLIGISFFILLIIFIVSISEFRNFLEKRATSTNIILVLFTLIITLSAFYIDRFYKKIQTDNALMSVSILNHDYASDFTKDEQKEWIYWNYFLLKPYDENIGYIITNYPKKCVEDFFKVTRTGEVLNEMNHILNENTAFGIVSENEIELTKHDILFSTLKDEMAKRANIFKDLLSVLLLDCYNYDIQSKNFKP